MTDNELLIKAATKAANDLRMPLGDVEPLKMIHMYQCLYKMMGGDTSLMIHWLNQHNTHLGYCPAAHLTNSRMDDTINYLQEFCDW